MKDYITLLSQTSLFENIDANDIPAMLTCLQAKKESFIKNSFVCLEGDLADFIGIVLSGNIQVLHYDINGTRNITASFSVGDIFAESVSCAEISKLPFSIQAITDCDILFLNKNQILHYCGEECIFHSKLVENLLKIISRKNILLTQKLRHMSHRCTAEKLLSYLNEQAKYHGSNEFTIPFDRQALADYIGVDRSAMSAEISKLQKQGILETKRNWFRLC